MHSTRSVHLVDLENLCARGLPTASLIENVWRTYRYDVSASPWDDYAVRSGHLFAVLAWLVHPPKDQLSVINRGHFNVAPTPRSRNHDGRSATNAESNS